MRVIQCPWNVRLMTAAMLGESTDTHLLEEEHDRRQQWKSIKQKEGTDDRAVRDANQEMSAASQSVCKGGAGDRVSGRDRQTDAAQLNGGVTPPWLRSCWKLAQLELTRQEQRRREDP